MFPTRQPTNNNDNVDDDDDDDDKGDTLVSPIYNYRVLLNLVQMLLTSWKTEISDNVACLQHC
jgi:hypothetical protein